MRCLFWDWPGDTAIVLAASRSRPDDGEDERRPLPGRAPFDFHERAEEPGDLGALGGRDATHPEPPARRDALDERRSERDERAPRDVGDDDIEAAVDLAERCVRRIQAPAHAVERGIASGRLDGVRLHVDRDDARRPEREGAQPQDAAPAADVEDPLTADDPLDQLLDEHPGGGMVAAAEAAEAELDQPRQIGAVVLGPRDAHAEPRAEREWAGVPRPCLETRPAVRPGHGDVALDAQRCREVLRRPGRMRCPPQRRTCQPSSESDPWCIAFGNPFGLREHTGRMPLQLQPLLSTQATAT